MLAERIGEDILQIDRAADCAGDQQVEVRHYPGMLLPPGQWQCDAALHCLELLVSTPAQYVLLTFCSSVSASLFVIWRRACSEHPWVLTTSQSFPDHPWL